MDEPYGSQTSWTFNGDGDEFLQLQLVRLHEIDRLIKLGKKWAKK